MTETARKQIMKCWPHLSSAYIRSVQNGDVGRFEEILADDFLCSNPDGSLVDRQQFLV